MSALADHGPKDYILAHDNRVKQLDRLTLTALRDLYGSALALEGMIQVYGGPVSKDEFVHAIIDVEFPEISAAREAYAKPIT